MDFAGGLILPIPPLLQRPVELHGAGTRTVVGAATAIPAFFRMQDDRRLAFLGMGYEHVNLACLYTGIAPVADLRVE